MGIQQAWGINKNEDKNWRINKHGGSTNMGFNIHGDSTDRRLNRNIHGDSTNMEIQLKCGLKNMKTKQTK